MSDVTTFDRARIAHAALRDLPRDYARTIAADALGATRGPLPPFLSPVDDAKWWASTATVNELKAYAASAFLAMDPATRRAFLNWTRKQ